MEALFKRHFWVVHVLMVAVVAYLFAKGTNVIVGHLLDDATAVAVAPAATSKPTVKKRPKRFDLADEQNIFDALFEEYVPPSTTTDEGTTDTPEVGDTSVPSWENAELSELRAKVVGTVVFGDHTLSLASIIDESEGRKAEARLYSVNECEAPRPEASEDAGTNPNVYLPPVAPCKTLMETHTVWHIGVERVYVMNTEENKMEYLLVDDPNDDKKKKKKKRKKRKKKKKDKGDKKDDFGEGISKVGPNSYEITQDEVDKALGNLSKLAGQARVVPAFENGETIGFKLFSIRPGSLYSKIGVRNGDIIQKVNGYEINSPDKALEIYQKLKSSKSISVDIKRRGKPVTIDYAITQ